MCDIRREAFCLPSILLILTYARIKGPPQQLCRTLSGIIYSHIDQKNEILNEKHAHSPGPTHTFFAICVQCQGHIEIDEMPWLPSANFVLSTSGLGELKSTSMFYPNIKPRNMRIEVCLYRRRTDDNTVKWTETQNEQMASRTEKNQRIFAPLQTQHENQREWGRVCVSEIVNWRERA